MKNLLQNIDWRLGIPALILTLLGLVTIYSISPILFSSQFVGFVLSIFAFFVFSQLNYRSLAPWYVIIYILSIITLAIVLLVGIESKGAVRWLEVFGVRLQLSETFKPFLAIAMSAFLIRAGTPTVKTFFKVFLLLLPVALLINFQPDLGNAMIYAIVVVLTLITYGFPLLWFFLSAIPLLIASPILWQFLRPYQKNRILTFISPGSDPLGTSYNAIQAMIAVGSGMFFGRGLGQGTQSVLRFLPERHTDFIFATFTEAFGFVGAGLIVVCFTILAWRMFEIFQRTEDPFGRIFTAAAFYLILVQFFVNVGMNVGIVPIVGVTLPFMSFGSNSLIANAILLGLVSSVSSTHKSREVLEIK
jgi:rod shape determining protein RodA